MHRESDPGGDEVVRQAGGVGLLPAHDQRQTLGLDERRQRFHTLWCPSHGDDDPLAVVQLRAQTAQQQPQVMLRDR